MQWRINNLNMRTGITRLIDKLSLNLPLKLMEIVFNIKHDIEGINMKKIKVKDYEKEYGIINCSGNKLKLVDTTTAKDVHLFFNMKNKKGYTKKERREWKKMQKIERQKSEGQYKGFTTEDVKRTGCLDYGKYDPYTGRTLSVGYDLDEYLQYGLDNYMHEINENLATGAIGCKVTQGWVVVPVYDLHDHEKSVDKVMIKIKQVAGLLEDGYKVCVCCYAGINRSNTVAIGALMYMDTSGKPIKKRWNIYHNLVKSKVYCCQVFQIIKGTCKAAVYALEQHKETETTMNKERDAYIQQITKNVEENLAEDDVETKEPYRSEPYPLMLVKEDNEQ